MMSNLNDGEIQQERGEMPGSKLKHRAASLLNGKMYASIGAIALLLIVTVAHLRSDDPWTSPARFSRVREQLQAALQPEGQGRNASGVKKERSQPWEERLYSRTICTNTCPHAQNGVCNDGRRGSGQVLCDLGTDCADCGSWSLRLPASLRSAPLEEPIAHLRDRNIKVLVKDTSTEPTFRMAYTDPAVDIDVSKQMEAVGWVEAGLTNLWQHVLQTGRPAACIQPDGTRSLVLDVGGNFGWYTLYAATLGCRVTVWEPVPHFRAFLQYGLQLNDLLASVDVRAAVVAPNAGEQYEVIVPQQGIWGTAGIGGANIDPNLGGGLDNEKVVVRGERLDDWTKEDVAMLKIDVEGFEPDVFASAGYMFERYTVKNVVIEYSPGVYERAGRWSDYHVWPDMLLRLQGLGFTLMHVDWPLAKAGLPKPGSGPGKPALPLITPAALRHDRQDADALSRRVLACPTPGSSGVRFPGSWQECNRVPHDLHPKSFHSEFLYNTNVFATADASLFGIAREVGVHLPNQTEEEWFGLSGMAMGGSPCQNIPQPDKVRLRCPCTDPRVCGVEAALAESYARGAPFWKFWGRQAKLVG